MLRKPVSDESMEDLMQMISVESTRERVKFQPEKFLVMSILKQALDDAMMYRRPRYLPGLIQHAKKKHFDKSVYILFTLCLLSTLSQRQSGLLSSPDLFVGLDAIKRLYYKRYWLSKFKKARSKSKSFIRRWNVYGKRRKLEEISYEAREWIDATSETFVYYCQILNICPDFAAEKMKFLISKFDEGKYKPILHVIF